MLCKRGPYGPLTALMIHADAGDFISYKNEGDFMSYIWLNQIILYWFELGQNLYSLRQTRINNSNQL